MTIPAPPTILQRIAASLASLLICFAVHGQETYRVDISRPQPVPLQGHLRLGTNTSNNGHSLDANSLYFIKDGQPWYPVMGEFHFSRCPVQDWETSILAMKSAGINIIATYIFWIYHEETEGRFNWKGNRDLRRFIALCQKHNMFVFVRIGPWCHGEARNGGLPDWIVKRGNVRKNDSLYLGSVNRLYQQIAEQLQGLYFRNGGPVIGTQIENEFRFNQPAGLEHMLTLKRMAVAAGIDVPYYTATAWQGADLKQNELIPVWGAYPEAPWDKRTTQLPLSVNYQFSLLRNDPTIGTDLLGQRKDDTTIYRGYRYPFATAEMGSGIQVTYHRRPIITAEDVTALAYVKLGSGANLMGYYMFHGGSHAIGEKSTMQESRATNYPNDYPIINYDFQAPIGEYGQIRPSYRSFKVLHSFLTHFGDSLAKYDPYFPEQKPPGPEDSTTLRFSVRAKGDHGFVFISNYQRQLKLKSHKQVQIELTQSDGHTRPVFDTPISVQEGLMTILPFHLDMDGVILESATLQPLTILKGAIPTYIFFQPQGLEPVYVFSKKGIRNLVANGSSVRESGVSYRVSGIHPGTGAMIMIKLQGGKQVNVLTLTRQQALNCWQGMAFGKERLLISPQSILFDGGKVKLKNTTGDNCEVLAFPAIQAMAAGKLPALKAKPDGFFSRFKWKSPFNETAINTKQVDQITVYDQDKALPPDDRNEKNTAARPGPQYQTNLQPVKGARQWRIQIPPVATPVVLNIDYLGDTGAAYENGQLIADDFFYGRNWEIGLPASNNMRELVIQIVPFSKERDVYFEREVDASIRSDMNATIRSVRLKKEYSTELSAVPQTIH